VLPKPQTAYIDTSVLKFSVTALLRLFPRTQTIDWGDAGISEFKYYEPLFVNPNDKIRNAALRREVDLLPAVADLVKVGRLVAVTDMETRFESWGLPKMDSWTGVFYAAPIGDAPPPVNCNRLLFCAGRDAVELQRQFLRKIKHSRFLRLQRITGGYQGKDRYCWRQMLDAFALWCAEHNCCDYFLTLDLRLIKQVQRCRDALARPALVRPSDLLNFF
jgi:hypothetical protein